jgi:hypothetical protein
MPFSRFPQSLIFQEALRFLNRHPKERNFCKRLKFWRKWEEIFYNFRGLIPPESSSLPLPAKNQFPETCKSYAICIKKTTAIFDWVVISATKTKQVMGYGKYEKW